jgi:glycosyltransferase involved in cell wall biosynthesis
VRFSILLPTRNRLEYLKLAVQSVLRQDFQDWELIVSDNCSQEDIEGHLACLADARIIYRRTERPVPVTENWNRALAYSGGEYVLMLGDDDALLDGQLRRIHEMIMQFNEPDLIYKKTLLFTYPGVDPLRPAGYLTDHGCAEFFSGVSEPVELDHAHAVDLVSAAMRFQLRFDFNAQFAFINRRLIESLSEFGDFYQSAFPDFYSMNAAFLRAHAIIIDPVPGVVIGVTPKSYGYYHLNDREAEGRSFLHGSESQPVAGTNMNVGWMSAVSALESGVAAEFGLQANRRRYRFVQAVHVYKRYRFGETDRTEVRNLERELPLVERWLYRAVDGALAIVHRAVPRRAKQGIANVAVRTATRRARQLPGWEATTIEEGQYANILDVLDAKTPYPGDPAGRLGEDG